MSVTISATMGPITEHRIGCGNPFCTNRMTDHTFATWAEANAFLQAELDTHGCTGHLAVCGDDICEATRMQIHFIEEAPSPSVGCSEFNAQHLLAILGFEADEHGHISRCGTEDAQKFLGRVLMATAVNPADAGVPSTSARGEGGMLMIEGGRREGWTEDYLEALREVAEFAIAHGRQITWG